MSEITIGIALHRLKCQAAMLSTLMRLAESDGEALDEGAAVGISDVCDDIADLAGRVGATLEADTLDLDLVEWDDDEGDLPGDTDEEPHGPIILADAEGRRKLNKLVQKLDKAVRKLKAKTR